MPVCLSVCLVVCVSMYIQGVHGGDLLAIPHVVSTSVGSCDVDIRPVSPALSECAHSTLLEPHIDGFLAGQSLATITPHLKIRRHVCDSCDDVGP